MKDYLDRRDFLKIIGLLSMGFARPAFSFPLEDILFDKKLHKLERTLPLMDTLVTITVYDSSKDKGQEAIELGFLEMKRLINIFNRYEGGTQISHLNEHGILKDVPKEIYFVIKKASYYHHLSNGAFDITIKPIVDLFKERFRVGSPPTKEEVKETLSLVDANELYFDENKIKFLKNGMGITLDGIAKGYIVDSAAGLIKKMGIEYALINAGGDIRAIGNKYFRIAIRNPFKPNDYVDIVNLKDAAIATSGNYERYFDKEKKFYHIVDPKTGYSPLKLSSISVVAKTVTDADAISTAAFLFSPLLAKRFIEGISASALIITRNGFQIRSKGWPC